MYARIILQWICTHGQDETTLHSVDLLFIVKKKRATVNVYRISFNEEFQTSKIKEIFHVLHENISK